MVNIFRNGLFLCTALCLTHGFAQEDDPLTPKEIQLSTSQPEKKVRSKSPTVKAAFTSFTGKISGDKVRMRLQPDLDGYIVRELNKSELVSVTDVERDFYCIEPPEAIKAYIFRSFVLDGVVEGNRVNVRLEPDLEAPVIGHLSSGDRIEGEVSSLNKKWLEIAPPSTTRFYVAKSLIDHIGGPEYKEKMDRRKETVEQLLEAANLYSKTELEHPFEDINFDQIKEGYLTIIHDYTDFPKKAELARDALAHVQEEYLQKRIDYLEKKAALVSSQPNSGRTTHGSYSLPSMHMWEPVEEALYANWSKLNDERSKEEFYSQEKLIAVTITGNVEPFTSSVHNKPGDYLIKQKNLPVAYVYSTKIDLNDYIGKQVTLIGSPRSNNNFAFPAYYIHEVE